MQNRYRKTMMIFFQGSFSMAFINLLYHRNHMHLFCLLIVITWFDFFLIVVLIRRLFFSIFLLQRLIRYQAVWVFSQKLLFSLLLLFLVSVSSLNLKQSALCFNAQFSPKSLVFVVSILRVPVVFSFWNHTNLVDSCKI